MTETDATPEPVPGPLHEEAEGAMPFDKDLCRMFRSLSHEAFMAHPELRSVIVVFDYGGKLNEASVDKGIWLGDSGAVQRLDAVFGSLQNTMVMLETQFVRAMQINQGLREQAVALGSEVTNKRQELEQLNQQLRSARSDAGAAAGKPEH